MKSSLNVWICQPEETCTVFILIVLKQNCVDFHFKSRRTCNEELFLSHDHCLIEVNIEHRKRGKRHFTPIGNNYSRIRHISIRRHQEESLRTAARSRPICVDNWKVKYKAAFRCDRLPVRRPRKLPGSKYFQREKAIYQAAWLENSIS